MSRGIGHRPIQGPKRRRAVDLRCDIGLDDFGELGLEAIQLRIPGLPVIREAVAIVVLQVRCDLGAIEQQRTLGHEQTDGVLDRVHVPHHLVGNHEIEDLEDVLRCRPGRERQPRRADLDPMLAQQGHRLGGPSVAVLLAEEQLAGRLRIAPEAISTTSELRTPMMTARIQEAFGVRPFDLYGTTEGLWGAECEHHTGIHLFEDMTIVENVDEDGRPVPDGQPGARLLVTSLFNRTQPLIRLELADAVVLDPDRCPCGRTLRRIRSIHGRSDDVLELPGTGAATVSVHPLQFAVVARDRDVVEFQVVQEGSRLRVLVVARGEAPTLEARLRGAVEQRLRELGVAEPVIQVERRTAVPRQPGGKLQLIVADRSARQTAEPSHQARR
jgi:hypothetical protein